MAVNKSDKFLCSNRDCPALNAIVCGYEIPSGVCSAVKSANDTLMKYFKFTSWAIGINTSISARKGHLRANGYRCWQEPVYVAWAINTQ